MKRELHLHHIRDWTVSLACEESTAQPAGKQAHAPLPRSASSSQSSRSCAPAGSRSPFHLLLDSMSSVLISIISFDLAHVLLLIPRYDFGSHDGNASRRAGWRAAEGDQTRQSISTLAAAAVHGGRALAGAQTGSDPQRVGSGSGFICPKTFKLTFLELLLTILQSSAKNRRSLLNPQ